MNTQEYLQSVTEQMRCKSARPRAEKEIKGHMEDLVEHYKSNGLTESEALEETILDMGDPVEVGVSLDQAHRPKMNWRLIGFIGLLSLLGFLLQSMIQSRVPELYIYNLRQISYLGFGFLLMIIICLIDYSIIGKYSKIVTFIFLAAIVTLSTFFSLTINGAAYYVDLRIMNLSLPPIMYLFVPLYAMLLYQYKNESYQGIIKLLLWLAVGSIISVKYAPLSTTFSVLLICILLLTFTLWKHWYQVNIKKTIITIWSTIIALPVVGILILSLMGHISQYQTERLQAWFMPSYFIDKILTYISSSHLLSSADVLPSSASIGMELNLDYLFLLWISYFGIIVGIVIIGLLIFLLLRVFKIAKQQRNQLGRIVGVSCGLVLSFHTIAYILMNLGVIPTTFCFLPFFTFSGSGYLVTFAILGLLLSIYRYEDVLPDSVPQKIKS